MNSFEISPAHLSPEEALRLVRDKVKISLSAEAEKRIKNCRTYLDHRMETSEVPIYGINTGFGSLCDTQISKGDLEQLQRNLVMSHACGAGAIIHKDIIKLMLLLKVQGLSYGHSGVELITVQRLVDFFNEDILPVVYEQGSLGASGDLAPLAHLSLPLLGMGEVFYQNEIHPAADVLKRKGWEPVKLRSKEGLALLNGTQFMSSYGVWCLTESLRLLHWADLIAAVSLEAFDGRTEPFLAPVHQIRNQAGQMTVAKNIRALLEGSEIANRDKKHVQDPYSFRCIPQVHGAVRDAMDYIGKTIENEINAVTDNPTIFPEEDLIVSAGNFHGEPLALALDHLAISMSEIGSISERRIYKLISGTRGLPPFLVANPGLNSGFMIPQYSAASMVSQNKQLSTPASVDTIDSSQGQEDHVSMGANAATKAYRVVLNTRKVLAVELLNAMQALEFRRPLKSSPALEDLFREFRLEIDFVKDDVVLYPFMQQAENFIIRENPQKWMNLNRQVK